MAMRSTSRGSPAKKTETFLQKGSDKLHAPQDDLVAELSGTVSEQSDGHAESEVDTDQSNALETVFNTSEDDMSKKAAITSDTVAVAAPVLVEEGALVEETLTHCPTDPLDCGLIRQTFALTKGRAGFAAFGFLFGAVIAGLVLTKVTKGRKVETPTKDASE